MPQETTYDDIVCPCGRLLFKAMCGDQPQSLVIEIKCHRCGDLSYFDPQRGIYETKGDDNNGRARRSRKIQSHVR